MIQAGSKLAHYEVVSTLGKGGMGEEWRARDQKLGREVAIKTLPAEFAKDEELRVDPLWDPLRDHPRFQALLVRDGK